MSSSDHVPYIAEKLSARAFQRYMGRYGSDEEKGSRQAGKVGQSKKASSATIVALLRQRDTGRILMMIDDPESGISGLTRGPEFSPQAESEPLKLRE